MTQLIQTINSYFVGLIAMLVIIQPVMIPLSGAAQAVASLATKRGWDRVAVAFVAISKLSGALAIIDLGRAGRFTGLILQLLASWQTMQKAKRISAEMAKTMGPPLALIACLGALSVPQGCALFRGAVVAGQAACQSELVNAPDVIAEAKVRGVSVGQLVDAFCGLVDVAAIFTAESKPSVARQAMSPRNQAVTLLRAKGEIE